MAAESVLDHLAFHRLTSFFQAGAGGGDSASFEFEVGRGYLRSVGHNDGSFDPVLELAHIARPAMLLDGANRLSTQPRGFFAVLGSKTTEEILRQQSDDRDSFPQ